MGVDSSSTSASCVGSNPTDVILSIPLEVDILFAEFVYVRLCQNYVSGFAGGSVKILSMRVFQGGAFI